MIDIGSFAVAVAAWTVIGVIGGWAAFGAAAVLYAVAYGRGTGLLK